ncbi:hypothetical protein V8F20_012484 [Naviculisporaceae sp. PSN 640]
MGKKVDEEALRKEALRKALLKMTEDDLGIHRVEELPMQDRDSGPSCRPTNQGAPRPPPLVPQQPHRRLNPSAEETANRWKAVIDSGEFIDSDYYAVKDLDDLGDESGRLYANRPRGGYGFPHRDMPMHPELQGRIARRFHNNGHELPPSSLGHPQPNLRVSKLGIVRLDGDAPITALNKHKGTATPQPDLTVPRAPPLQPNGARPVSTMAPKPGIEQGGICPTAQVPERPTQLKSPTQSHGNSAPSNGNVPVPNPQNIVFDAPILYVARRRGNRETPGRVTLHQPPKKGLFRLWVSDNLLAEHGLAEFQNLIHNRSENIVTLRFNDSSVDKNTGKDKKGIKEGVEKEHTIKFRTEDDTYQFQETFNLVWAGVSVPVLQIKKPAQSNASHPNGTGAAKSLNGAERAIQNGASSSMGRHDLLSAQIGQPAQNARNGDAVPGLYNRAPPQTTHWGARLASAADFDPFSVTIGSPRPKQVQSPAPATVPQLSNTSDMLPPPGFPPRAVAPPSGLPALTAGKRVPPGFTQGPSQAVPASVAVSTQQPNPGPPTSSATQPCPPAPTPGLRAPPGFTQQHPPALSTPVAVSSQQPETRKPMNGHDASGQGTEAILKTLATLAGITEADAEELINMPPVQAVAKILTSLKPGTLDNLALGSLDTPHPSKTGQSPQKKESAESSSDPRVQGEDPEDKAPDPKKAADSSNSRRVQYSANELRAFRPNAVRPPHWLNELRFLPARGEKTTRTSTPARLAMPSLEEQLSRIQASAYEVDLVKKAASSGYVAKQAEHIKAVLRAPTDNTANVALGETAAKAVVGESGKAFPETAVSKPDKAAPEAKAHNSEGVQQAASQPWSTGLQASVWAAGKTRVEHPNAFAGAIAQYPQHSYFNDLMLLVDDTVPNSGGEPAQEAPQVRAQPEPPRVRGLGASRHAGPPDHGH